MRGWGLVSGWPPCNAGVSTASVSCGRGMRQPTTHTCVGSNTARVPTAAEVGAILLATLPLTLADPTHMVHPCAGSNNARDVHARATSLLHDRHITRVATGAELDAFLSTSPSLAHVLLFTSKAEPTVLAKGLSCALQVGMGY